MAIKAQPITITITAITASTGLEKTGDSANIAVRLIKDGTSGARHDATAIAEVDATNAPGEYSVVLDATDTNANTITVKGKSSTSGVTIMPVKIVTEQGKIATLQADTDDIQTRIPDALVAGNLKVDVLAISGDATAADNLEAGYDGTGYAGGTTKQLVEVNTKTGFSLQTAPPTTAEIKTAIEAAGSSLAQILADTGEMQTDLVNGGRLDLLIDSITTHLTDIKGAGWSSQTLQAIITAIGTRMATFTYTAPDNTGIGNALIQATEANTHAHSIETKVDTLDTIADAVKLKTDLIPASPAAVGSAMTLTSAYDNAKTAWSTLTAQQVWEYSTRGLTTFGTLIADTATAVWGAVIRTLTSGGSLTAQETRDAMKLAPSAGAAATDSIDDKLDGIDDQTSQLVFTTPGKVDATAQATVDEAAIAAAVIAGLGGATVTVQSMITAGGDITLIRGVTYTAELHLTYTYTGSLTGYTAAMYSTGAGITNKPVTISGSAGAWILTVAFTGVQSAALNECLDDYSITFTKTSDSTILGYGVEGNITVRDWAGL